MNLTAVLLLVQSVIPVAKEDTFHVCDGRKSRAVMNEQSRQASRPMFILRAPRLLT